MGNFQDALIVFCVTLYFLGQLMIDVEVSGLKCENCTGFYTDYHCRMLTTAIPGWPWSIVGESGWPMVNLSPRAMIAGAVKYWIPSFYLLLSLKASFSQAWEGNNGIQLWTRCKIKPDWTLDLGYLEEARDSNASEARKVIPFTGTQYYQGLLYLYFLQFGLIVFGILPALATAIQRSIHVCVTGATKDTSQSEANAQEAVLVREMRCGQALAYGLLATIAFIQLIIINKVHKGPLAHGGKSGGKVKRG